MNAFAATHDAAVKMIDTSIIRVHQHAACITRNVETTGRAEGCLGFDDGRGRLCRGDGLPERLQPPIIAHGPAMDVL